MDMTQARSMSAGRAREMSYRGGSARKGERLEKEVMELRAFRLLTKGVLTETRRMLNSLEEELFFLERP